MFEFDVFRALEKTEISRVCEHCAYFIDMLMSLDAVWWKELVSETINYILIGLSRR